MNSTLFFVTFQKQENPIYSNIKNNIECKTKHKNVCGCNYKFDTFLQKNVTLYQKATRVGLT